MITTVAFLFPLVCWLFAVRTVSTGWIVGILLALLAATEIALAQRWLLPDARVTLIVVITFVTAAVLPVGILIESRRPGVPKLSSLQGRGAAGMGLSLFYCVLGPVAALGAAWLVGINGVPAITPSDREVLPLPAGLAVVSDRDEGCGGGSETSCERRIEVRGTAGQSSDEVARELRDHLTRAHGWQFTLDHGSLGACRDEDRGLDRHQVCAEVVDDKGTVSVLLDASDRW
ncbi:hypothetical protein [Kitasatospora sp. NBC_01302]|uniref:hypothetical protein n=1 Tax=Kitasatospora sp. NBC_01302 TaxID=2903575 RepID=UPI002E15A660|nr:hypothetical protein OG294_18695 [Kitasatospora sp. NBC_01302]